jgi:2-polyprenyl-3-methyl-5-hydroxy-6-metoxy-1,4-benzoquinol methylase
MTTLTAQDVRQAYKFFLNREPESEAVISEKLKHYSSFDDLRRDFINSPEFQLLSSPSLQQEVYRAFWSPAPKVEVDVGPDMLGELLDRVRKQWSKLGESEPYWSVLTEDKFRLTNMTGSNLDEFYSSGARDASAIKMFEERTSFTVNKGTCLELGCGVGRVTRHLAKLFDTVIAVDISPANLQICADHLESEGSSNVKTILLTSPDELSKFGPIDFFYSIIVLQHNPPPVQKAMLQQIFSQLNPRGSCLFQTPHSLPGYRFVGAEALKEPERIMDMHCLPKEAVLNVFRDHGLQLLDVAPDPWTGIPLASFIYFANRQ